MTINPTYLAQRTRSCMSLNPVPASLSPGVVRPLEIAAMSMAENPELIAPRSQQPSTGSPEIQTMYSLNIPVSAIRTKIRQEFEKHRYVKQLGVVDVLLFQSHSEFQETLNFWKQLSHVMKYFRPEEEPGARLPPNFISGFLEGRN
ncbi:hypothetical protein N8T08_003449 [Aspergillus melleus]|uniref:Uncharacterized protein n=1 Tax=Aspergillus melleus TaxID=138277 RepID=A0ACC3BGX1_9EURO|nr:hypothetical protein N8T08_003449 [Aspergillus melleus]